jgi:thiamine pyrophosphate-dependent acetolactate synthase large subunit-like protein
MWTAQRVRPNTPRDFCTSAGLGSMGFGFPSAIGACFANPGRPVFAVCGDGGFQMTMPELATVKRYQVPVKIVLIDNRNLGMVRQWQELFYDERYSATNLSDNPDFCTIASAYDIESFRINGPEDAPSVLEAFLAYTRAGVAARIVLSRRTRLADDPGRRRGRRPDGVQGLVTYEMVVGDPRTVARVINMAHRFQCRATRVDSTSTEA